MADEFVTVEVRNVQNVIKAVSEYEKKKEKALATAIKVEAFRLRTEIRKGINQADPGGQPLERLTAIARMKNGRFKPDIPLKGLGKSARYDFDPVKMTAQVGWTDQSGANLRKRATRFQAGFVSPVTSKQRSILARMGGSLGKRSLLKKFFFIRKKTTVFKVPQRQIIGPLYKHQKSTIQKNIIHNFRIKMQGGRI